MATTYLINQTTVDNLVYILFRDNACAYNHNFIYQKISPNLNRIAEIMSRIIGTNFFIDEKFTVNIPRMLRWTHDKFYTELTDIMYLFNEIGEFFEKIRSYDQYKKLPSYPEFLINTSISYCIIESFYDNTHFCIKLGELGPECLDDIEEFKKYT